MEKETRSIGQIIKDTLNESSVERAEIDDNGWVVIYLADTRIIRFPEPTTLIRF